MFRLLCRVALGGILMVFLGGDAEPWPVHGNACSSGNYLIGFGGCSDILTTGVPDNLTAN